MKSKIIFLIILVILLSACNSTGNNGNQADTGSANPTLLVSNNNYSQADLEAMSKVESEFNGVAYVGVPVQELLADAGVDLSMVKAIKAVAADGYSVNYDPTQLTAADVIVAYAQADGSLSEEDGDFRMVLPDQEGKMNLRMLVELQIVE